MQLAIAEAKKGIALTSPNPAVGAVIVKDDVVLGKVVLGKGWHRRAGLPHAEREAIADVLANHPSEDPLEVMKGATIYVTLEPCSTQGRTPPCTQGILDHGIGRVVYGAKDPNPHHVGRAQSLLEKAGVLVTTGVCETECLSLIRAFSKVQRTGLPWIILKSAISLDGKITRPPGESQWLTSPESRQHVQQIRYSSDAIITGGNTLRIDDPALTVRNVCNASKLKDSDKPQPWRMIITRSKSSALPQSAQVFTDEYRDRTLVQENGDILSALKTLVKKGCNSVLVEAGGTLMAAFIEAGLVDEVAIFYAPLMTGGDMPGFSGLPHSVKLTDAHFTQIGNDILLSALVEQ